MKQFTMHAAVAAALVCLGPARPGKAADEANALNAGQIQQILNAHDKYRSEVGDPPLRWSASLAESARQWASHLASSGQIYHSNSGNGENLAESSDAVSFSQFVEMWGQEKRNFVAGIFPNVSRTGNWQDVGHYTQLVWKKTSEVGCGLAHGSNWYVFVCQYKPAGNIVGQPVF